MLTNNPVGGGIIGVAFLSRDVWVGIVGGKTISTDQATRSLKHNYKHIHTPVIVDNLIKRIRQHLLKAYRMTYRGGNNSDIRHQVEKSFDE